MGNQMVTWPMMSRDPEGQVMTQCFEKNCRCYLATIANY